jgi:hypothetical protein
MSDSDPHQLYLGYRTAVGLSDAVRGQIGGDRGGLGKLRGSCRD